MNTLPWNDRIQKLAESVTYISRPPVFDKVAVIIEPRNQPVVENLLIWMVHLLAPHGWKFIFFAGTNNIENITAKVDKLCINDIVEIRNLSTENLSIKDYNLLLTSTSFWSSLPFENVLIFQSDTVILDGDLSTFLEYEVGM